VEEPDRPAASSRHYGEHQIRIVFTQPRIPRRWIQAEATYPVTFDSATAWITRLADAHARGRLTAELRRLNRFRVLVVDEVGYLPFDTASAALFFQLVASRYETGSIVLTSNLVFSRWGETLGDDVVAAATIDRLVHHAHVIALDGDSYRTRAHRKTPPPAANTKTK